MAAFGFGVNDTLVVLDGSVVAHIFAPPPELSYVRTVKLPVPATGPIDVHGVYGSGLSMGAAGVRPPLLMTLSGVLVNEFGTREPARHPTDRAGVIAAQENGDIWIANGTVYAVEQLSTEGRVRRRIERDFAWFPLQARERQSFQDAPPARIQALFADPSKGLLWVLIRRPGPNWKRSTIAAPVAPGTAIPPSALRREGLRPDLYETVLDVIDVGSGRTLGTTTLSGGTVGFTREGHLVEATHDESGRTSLRLWQLSARR